MKLKSTTRFFVASAIAVLLASHHAHAAIIYWDGTPSQSWSTAANWSTSSSAATPEPGSRPLAADDAVFNISTANATITMNLAGNQAAKSLTFRSTGGFTVNSNPSTQAGNKTLTIGVDGITKTSNSGVVNFNGSLRASDGTLGRVDVIVGASQTWTNNNSATAINLGTTVLSPLLPTPATNVSSATLALGGNTLTLDGDGSFNFGNTTATTSVISGTTASSLIKNGTGTLTINSSNTFAGAITLNAGTLALANNGAAGTSAGGITLAGSSAATLQINSGITTADNIVFSNTNASSRVNRALAAGAYTTGTSGSLSSSFAGGTPDTTASFLGGTSAAGGTLEMSFAGSSLATNDFVRRSDVFTTGGIATAGDTYVLSLFGGLASDSFLARLDDSTNSWIAAGTNFLGAIAYNSGTHILGDYGFDSTNNSVWAVVNYGDSFAAVPEPTSALAGLLLGAGLLRRKRNNAR